MYAPPKPHHRQIAAVLTSQSRKMNTPSALYAGAPPQEPRSPSLCCLERRFRPALEVSFLHHALQHLALVPARIGFAVGHAGLGFEVLPGPRGVIRAAAQVPIPGLDNAWIDLAVLCEGHHELRRPEWQLVAQIHLPCVPRLACTHP